MRRPLRLREGDPRADQERRRPHQAQPLGRHHGAGVGPAPPLVPARRRAQGRLRHLPPARIQGDGARHQPGCGEERDPPRRAQRRARLHPRRRVHRALPRARHLVRADARRSATSRRARPSNDWEKRWVKQRNLSHALCCRADAASGVHAEWFRKALDAGVKMALGSDIRPLQDAALLEIGLWVRDGATPWQALQAATRHGAAVCGVGDELGTVEVGKRADLIVVAGNPLEDIHNVRRLRLVLKDGRVVSDKRRAGALSERRRAMSEAAAAPQVAVVGAGIVGCCIALDAAASAAPQVTLIDRDEPGRGCSFGNSGAISPSSIAPLAMPGVLASVPAMLLDAQGPLHLPLALPAARAALAAALRRLGARRRAVARELASGWPRCTPARSSGIEALMPRARRARAVPAAAATCTSIPTSRRWPRTPPAWQMRERTRLSLRSRSIAPASSRSSRASASATASASSCPTRRPSSIRSLRAGDGRRLRRARRPHRAPARSRALARDGLGAGASRQRRAATARSTASSSRPAPGRAACSIRSACRWRSRASAAITSSTRATRRVRSCRAPSCWPTRRCS